MKLLSNRSPIRHVLKNYKHFSRFLLLNSFQKYFVIRKEAIFKEKYLALKSRPIRTILFEKYKIRLI